MTTYKGAVPQTTEDTLAGRLAALGKIIRKAWEALKKAVSRAFAWIRPRVYKAEILRIDKLLQITKNTNARRKLLRRRNLLKEILRKFERGGTE